MHQKLVKDEASAPYIYLCRVNFSSEEMLWCTIKWRRYIRCVLPPFFPDMVLVNVPREAEVDYLEYAFTIEKDILRLDISVKHFVLL